MNRFMHAALSDEELAKFTDRFANAAKLLKVDELKIEHKEAEVEADSVIKAVFVMPTHQVSTLTMRLGDKWLGIELDWMAIEDARGGNFDRISRIAITMAQMLKDGAGVTRDKFQTVNRFAAVVGELDFDKEKS